MALKFGETSFVANTSSIIVRATVDATKASNAGRWIGGRNARSLLELNLIPVRAISYAVEECAILLR